jgi:hypothetical protein
MFRALFQKRAERDFAGAAPKWIEAREPGQMW